MAFQATCVSVMIASPSDVVREREIAREVANEWNTVHALTRRQVLLTVGWETHIYVDTGETSEYINDRTSFDFRVEGRIEDGQLFYELYGPVVAGPPRYQGLICNIIVRADGSDWRIDSVFKVGPSVITRDHREDFRHPEGTVMNGRPKICRFGEIQVIEPGE